MNTVGGLLAAVAVCATALGVQAGAQPAQLALPGSLQPPTFKSGVNAVLVDVRVVDKDGQFVGDLQQNDFTVLEDGREQSVATFQRVRIPAHPDDRPVFASGPVDADVASNGGTEGRLYILLLDDYHTHAFRSVTVRALAREFIENYLDESDRAVVLTTSGRVSMTQEFTNNRKRLLGLVDQFQGGFEALSRCEMVAPPGQEKSSSQNRVLTALAPVAESGSCTMKDDRSTLDVLSQLSSWLAPVNMRRKAIVFISEGFEGRQTNAFDEPESDTDAFLDDLTGGSATRSKVADAAAAISGDFRELVTAAARSNVSIYAIDPNGDPNQPAKGVKPVAALGDESQFDARHLANRMMLDALASATGGVSLTRSNGFSDQLARVVADTSSYYLLGYTPTNAGRADAFRRLDVRVTRPGVTVQSRAGYVPKLEIKDGAKRPASADVPPSLTELMATPAQVSGLTMGVSAAVFLGKGPRASVEVIVDVSGKDLALAPGPKGNGPLELLMAVADMDGKVKATEHGSFDLKFSAATREVIADNGLRVLSRLDVPPGRYLLRVAAVDTGGHAQGSVQYDLDVPDFTKGPLSMSSLAVSSASERRRPTTGSDRDWQERFSEAPTAKRVFSAGDELTVSGEIYGNEKGMGGVETTTMVQRETGQSVFQSRETLKSPDPGGKSTRFAHATALSLQGFEPGAYLLTVEARNPANPKSVVSRQIPFDVR